MTRQLYQLGFLDFFFLFFFKQEIVVITLKTRRKVSLFAYRSTVTMLFGPRQNKHWRLEQFFSLGFSFSGCFIQVGCEHSQHFSGIPGWFCGWIMEILWWPHVNKLSSIVGGMLSESMWATYLDDLWKGQIHLTVCICLVNPRQKSVNHME